MKLFGQEKQIMRINVYAPHRHRKQKFAKNDTRYWNLSFLIPIRYYLIELVESEMIVRKNKSTTHNAPITTTKKKKS